MKRQVILRANGAVIFDGVSIDPGSSPYPFTPNTPSKTLAEAWNDQDDASYAYCWPANSGVRAAVSCVKGPTLARFDKVTLTTGFDYSQTGANNWWFPPNNAHGPGCALILRKRDLSTWLVGTGAAAYQFLETDPNNVNLNAGPPPFKLYTLTWEMASHPEGGPWTLEDINALAAGVEFNFSLGPNGKAFDPSAGSFFKIRAPYLTVTLDIEDLGGFVDNVRFASSLGMRLMRRARNVIAPSTFADKAAAGTVGSRVYFSHPRGPQFGGKGWGIRRLERRCGQVLKRTYNPELFTIEDETFDLRNFACLGWAAYQIQCAWSPELQGLSLLDKGKSFVHARAQDAWSMRPGDGVLMRVLEGHPNLSFRGLAVAGGGDVAIAFQNFDLMQSGWSTQSAVGEFTVTADTDVHMAEEQGYLSSARLDYGAGGGTGGRIRSLGTLPRAAGDFLHLRAIVRNTNISNPSTQFAEVALIRTGGGLPAPEAWNEATRAWVTTAANNPIPSVDPFGEAVFDAIPCDAPLAASDPTYLVAVGRFSSAMGPATIHGAIVDVQHTDSTVAGARPSIVTLGSTITRVADVHKMSHVWGRELWVHERGTVVGEVRPWWRAADLPADAVKPILHAQHATDTWDALQFIPKTGSDDLIRFERGISGEGTFQLDCPIPGLDLTRAHVLRAWVRWLGPDGWTEYGPYSVEVGYAVFLDADGSLVSTGSVVGRLSSETAVPYARDYLGIGCDATRQLDGDVRLWETRRKPLHRLEAVWRV